MSERPRDFDHRPGEFEPPGLGRSELGFLMLCAWNNIDPGDAPEFWHRHANDATAKAWNRVAKAVRYYDSEQHDLIPQ